MLKSEAVKRFLEAKARPEFASRYNIGMEVQVNVAQGDGERVDKEYKGKKYSAWTLDGETWKSFRIPLHANTEPEYTDSELYFNLEKHVEGIGMTGWDWQQRKSLWVAYDFDAIVGHSDKHTAKLSDSELSSVKQAAYKIPWVTVVRSTSGNGLHLYVFLDGVDTKNHNEHAGLARAILSKMSAITGFDFDAKVDNCGHVMWVWHRKYEAAGGLEGDGLKIIKSGGLLTEVPPNWKDHIRVSSGKRARTIPSFVDEQEIDPFEQMCSQNVKVSLDSGHKALIDYLEQNGGVWWFDIDHHMLVCHTLDLAKAHEKLNFRGIFTTTSSGGSDQNCFAFPLRNGAWVVRRHTPGVLESDTWDQDSSGWTRCYFNREPDLKTAAKSASGAEDENGSFAFATADLALEALKVLGIRLELNEAYQNRRATLKPAKDNRLILEIDKMTGDNVEHFKGWVDKNKVWRKVINSQLPTRYEQEVGNYDDILRHVVAESIGDAGWCLKSEDRWELEPLPHIKLALKAMGNSAKDSDLILGQSVLKSWKLVNKPFQPEYIGNREWNRDAAQFTYYPSEDLDNLRYPTWMKLLNHCGQNVTAALENNDWAKANGIRTGADYLMLWVASVFQQPTEPLPYLFLYGPQGTGKSIFHEALSLLVTKGVVRADSALISQSGFNGELHSAVLCVVEETDLRQSRSMAYNRIKDWVTGRTISVHIKGATPFTAENTTHWIQCSNEMKACPIFPGDTRITMVHVEDIADDYIPKSKLIQLLKKEAPDFLAKILSIEIPESPERLLIPALDSAEKDKAAEANQSDLEIFVKENCYHAPGEYILIADFYEKFKQWLDPDRRHEWTSKQKVSRYMPDWVEKGRMPAESSKHVYGNISFTEPKEEKSPYILVGDKLVRKE